MQKLFKQFFEKANGIIITFLFVALYTNVLLVTSLGFFIDSSFLVNNSLIFSLLITLISGYYLLPAHISEKSRKHNVYLFNYILFLLALLLFILVSIFFWDNSYDGQTYHLQGIHEIYNGWNPVKRSLNSNVPNHIFINHYPKGFEIFGTAVYNVTHQIESCKVSNIILMTSAWILSFSYLKKIFPIKTKLAFLFSSILVLNPILSTQLFSFVVDGQIASLFIILVFSFLFFLKGDKFGIVIWSLAIPILIALKFTGLIYATILAFFATFYLLLFLVKRKRLLFKFILINFCLFTISILVVSNNPYCTNIIAGKHIFYPLLGSGSANIMQGTNAPASFKTKNRFEKFLIANAAFSSNIHGAEIAPEPKLKIPFYIKLKEWTVFKSVSVLYGGLGPLFSGIILLSLALLFYLLFNKFSKEFIFIVASVLISILIIPECWLSRYVPQLWYLPILVLIFFAIQKNKSKYSTFLYKLTYGLLSINSLFIFLIIILSNIIITQQMKSEFSWLKSRNAPVSLISNDFISTEYRLKKYHIKYNTIDNPNTVDSSYLFRPISASSIIVLPKNTIPYKPNRFFKFLESYVKKNNP